MRPRGAGGRGGEQGGGGADAGGAVAGIAQITLIHQTQEVRRAGATVTCVHCNSRSWQEIMMVWFC